MLLQRNGINTTKDKDDNGGNEIKYKITVAKGDVGSAAQLLRDYSLPKAKFDGLHVFVKNRGMIPTATEERGILLEALGGEVANSLNKVPGVLEANVIVQIPEVNDLTQPDKEPLPSASVMIKFRPTAEQKGPPLDEKTVQKFVAYGVPKLVPDRVTVLFTQAAKPEAEMNPEERMVTILGITVTKASADSLKAMVGVGAFLLLAMAGLLAFTFLRGSNGNGNGHGNGNGNGSGKKRTSTEV